MRRPPLHVVDEYSAGDGVTLQRGRHARAVFGRQEDVRLTLPPTRLLPHVNILQRTTTTHTPQHAIRRSLTHANSGRHTHGFGRLVVLWHPDGITEDKIPQDKIPQDKILQDKVPKHEKWTKCHYVMHYMWANRFL